MKKLFCCLSFLAINLLAYSGNAEYAQTVQADTNGNFTANIYLYDSMPFDHHFQILVKTNVTIDNYNISPHPVDPPHTSYSIVINGHLNDKTQNGNFTFQYDPSGRILEGSINVLSGVYDIPTLSQWGLIILSLVILTMGIVYLKRR